VRRFPYAVIYVDLEARVVHVFRVARAGRYTTIETHARGETLRVAHFPDVEVSIDDLLGT
jgi:hypothetical protein